MSCWSLWTRSAVSCVLECHSAVGTKNQQSRETWLERVLAGIPAGNRILDAGAGELRYKRFCGHLDYVSQDFAGYDGVGDGLGLQTGVWDQSAIDIVSDIISIPEPDASFDAVMCVEVLEHLPCPVDGLRELTRLLRVGGRLILTAPFCSLTHFAPYYYQSGYSRYFYEYWLPALGYEILDIVSNGSYFEYLAQELRRLPHVTRRYCGLQFGVARRVAVRVLLGALTRWSRTDRGSDGLLSFGLHVLARKV